jgi:alpha-mannosidase
VHLDETALWRAWEPVLFNETHDLASGVMTDHVYDDTVRSYEFSNRLADGLIDSAWDALTSKIDTHGSGSPVVVFNTLGWGRSDIAEVDLGFTQPGLRGIGLSDERGKEVPFQIEQATYHEDGALKTARIAFVARDVPALGYRVFHVGGRDRAEKSSQPAAETGDTVETQFYRLTFDLASVAIKSLRVKPED